MTNFPTFIKNYLIPAFLLLFVINSSVAQITLENTYSNTKQFNFRVAQIDEETLVYYLLNDIDDVLEIYDLEHTLITSIEIPSSVRNGRNYIRALHVSKYLFDADDEYEYSVSFFNETGSTYFYSFYVLNEDGTVLLDASDFDVSSTVGDGEFGGTFGIFRTLTGDLKLVLDRLNADTSMNEINVYSLPGVLYELSIKEDTITNSIGVYPNPTKNKQNTIYHNFLQNGRVLIFNQKGQLIKSMKIDKDKRKTDINLSNLTSGLYFYQLYDGSQKIGDKKIISN